MSPETASAAGFDRLLELEPAQHGRAVRHLPLNLEVFASHFPRRPVLPGVLILEAMADLAAAVMEKGTDRHWELAGAQRLRFHNFAQPGDSLEITVTVQDRTDTTAELRAEASVDGLRIASARTLRLALVRL